MDVTGFTDRTYRVASDGRGVVCDTIAERGEVDALRVAIAWRRTALAADELQEADAVLRLRALIGLDDLLVNAVDLGSPSPLTVTRDQATELCEIAGAYARERDLAGYQSPEHRGRIGLLRALAGPLMDACCELAAAEDEAREKALLS
jgi:hypothetical protein